MFSNELKQKHYIPKLIRFGKGTLERLTYMSKFLHKKGSILN